MKRLQALVLLLVGTSLLIACGGPVPRVPPTPVLPRVLRVTGAADMTFFIAGLRDRARTHRPPLEVRYVPTDSDTGLRVLERGEADIALVSWLPAGPPAGYIALPLGTDDIAIVVHPRAGVSALTLEQVRRLFQGRHLTWAELGGADVPIRLVSRERGSGTRAAFEARVMAGARVALTAVVLPSGQAVVDYVARHEGAVGYASHRLVDARVRVLRVGGLLPGEKGYPLRRDLYALLPADAPAWVRRLLTP